MDPVVGVLGRVFGFRSFRPHQEEIIRALTAGRDILAVMPTGGGKSLCYQLPACLSDGVAVVVSPLIALMKDQVDAARAQGIAAATLNSAATDDERRTAMALLRSGRLRLLYLSPERLSTPGCGQFLRSFRLAFFAVDEAHCISEWGHDFRPDYLALSRLAADYPGVPIAAFTATATARVALDIEERLGLRDPHRVRASFNRPNLRYRVEPKTRVDEQIFEFLRGREDQSGIVYRATRKKTETTADCLRRRGIAARAYHAGMENAERAAAQEAFRRDEAPIVVATIAFGMGIDKPDVRFVVHGDMPKNIEGYYQETGRAGRDGAPSECLLLHSRADSALALRFAAEIADPAARAVAELQARQMADFTRSHECRRKALLAYFGEMLPADNCANCDVCLGGVQREEATTDARKALSAMVRTGGRFGAGHLTDILIGKAGEGVLRWKHHLLPTFGVGRDRGQAYWRDVFDELAVQGFAAKAEGAYPTLRATPEGLRLMRGELSFMKRVTAVRTRRERAAREAAWPADGGGEADYSTGLYATLRKLRMSLARGERIAPYMVFPDRTLQEMARSFPVAPHRLRSISGVGERKLEKYGDAFIAAVRDYLAEHPEEKPRPVRDGASVLSQ